MNDAWRDPENWMWRDGQVEAGPAVVFDVDGVLADASHRQHLLDWPHRDWDAFFEACGDDAVIEPVSSLLSVINPDHTIVLLTARPLRVRAQTMKWIEQAGLRWDLLIMRNWGDYMAAPHFKSLSVDELSAYGFDVDLAFDDDPRNVAMFDYHGIPCVYIHSGYHA